MIAALTPTPPTLQDLHCLCWRMFFVSDSGHEEPHRPDLAQDTGEFDTPELDDMYTMM